MTQPYELVIKAEARRVLAADLAPSVAFAVWEFISGQLREHPQRSGQPLVAPFQGDWSARRGHYRVRYRIDEGKHQVVVLDVATRTDIYDPGGA